jgi:hypothetical protein
MKGILLVAVMGVSLGGLVFMTSRPAVFCPKRPVRLRGDTVISKRVKFGSPFIDRSASLDSSVVGGTQHIECQINDRPSLANTDVDPALYSIAHYGSPTGLLEIME